MSLRSEELFRLARRLIPGGVNSPVRSFSAVGGSPPFISRGKGSRIWDADGGEYIDYVGSWGPLILGHAHEEVLAALRSTMERGTSFGAPTEAEVELASEVVRAVPSIEKVRMVNSGTEATLSAIRLARGATGRDAIVKLEGCYHGHADSLLVAAGSGVASLAIPGSPGVPKQIAALTFVAPFNDGSALERLFRERGKSIAALIVEPVAGNMGVVPPAPGYLETTRRVTREAGALLIFDEVMTGFRVAYGGAQSLYGIEPDLTTLGKIIGGGLPVGAYGGRVDLMDQMAPEGRIYQAGTLSGNPLAMAAGLATLRAIQRTQPYENLERLGEKLQAGLQDAAAGAGVPLIVQRVGSMLTPYFTSSPVRDFSSALRSSTKSYGRFFHGMLRRGHYFRPAQFEALFLSASHTEADVEVTLEHAGEVLQEINH